MHSSPLSPSNRLSLPFWAGLALPLLLALSAGCTTLPPAPPSDALAQAQWEAHRDRLSRLNDWTLRGRAAYTTPTEGGSLSLFWQHQGTQTRLVLTSALGQGGAELLIDPLGASLRDSEGREYSAESADALLQRLTGLPVPVSALSRWIIGLPEDDASPTRLDAQGRLRQLESDGWLVQYREYVEVNDHVLPRRLTVEREDLQLRLVIDAWTLP
ncbi:MAG: lipoprotein insertase outer membrane protein LolB [Pseudomonadota bacterium]